MFVSYAHADAERVYPLLQELDARGFNIWYDEGIEPGNSWREELAAAIENATRVVYLVSPTSVVSRNCIKEINFALSREIPITLVYLEPTRLPSALEFSLGDEQAIHAEHYHAEQFLEKLTELLAKSAQPPDPETAGAPTTKPGQIRRRWLLAAAALVAVFTIAGVWQWQATRVPNIAEDVRTLAVSPFAHHGEGAASWIGAALTNLVSDRLADSRHTELVSQTRWENLRGQFPDDADLHAYASKNGVRYVVSGEILETPARHLLSMRISDLVAGVDVGARTFEDITPQRLGEVATEIAMAIGQTLNLPTTQQRDTLSADFAAENYAAYQAYVAGLEFYNRFEYEEAAASMETALRLDPDFHMARFRLANIQLSQAATSLAQANLERIPANAALSQRERYYVDGLRLMVLQENTGAVDLFRQFSEEYPYEIEARQFLAESLWRNFETDAAIEVLDELATREPENHHVWAAMGYMQMSVQRYGEAENALQQYVRLAPQLPHPWELLGNLALHQQDPKEAQVNFRRALDIEANFSLAVLGNARATALLGDYDTAMDALGVLVADTTRVPRHRMLAALDLADLQMASAEFAKLDGTFAQVQTLMDAEGSRRALVLQKRGLAALFRGERDTARLLLNTAVEESPSGGVPTRYLFARGLFEATVGEVAGLPETIGEIRKYALPPDDPDRTEEKAALFLEGKMLAASGDSTGAIEKLEQARATTGYTYRSVDLALGESYAELGNAEAALDALTRAITANDQFMSGDPRLDLEFDRQRALSLGIALACENGSNEKIEQIAAVARKQWPARAAPAC